MIFSKHRFFFGIWRGIILICCISLSFLLLRNLAIFYAIDLMNNKIAMNRANANLTRLPTTTDLIQRLELDLKESPVENTTIIESINFLNNEHEVLNVRKFGALTQDSVNFAIVVQVHKRIEYFAHLVRSLRNVDGIREALLIFSHDVFDDDINQLVRSIDFCRVIQIMYPYNIQLFPNTYPGQDPRDCPAKPTSEQKATCKNRKHPDRYGNYRVATYAQVKHHWWWKMNYVFETILPKYQLDTYVMLLEEDHFVMPDALRVLQKMTELRPKFCAYCTILCLGAYLKNYRGYSDDINKLSVAPWFTSKHNMGMTLNSNTWQHFRNCSEMFCTYDDYNWDWTLLAIGMKCMDLRPQVLYANSPRVMHIGDCGMHANQCEPHDAATGMYELIEQNKHVFFPAKMLLADVTNRSLKLWEPNGGWGDVRDHALCLINSGYRHTFTPPDTFRRLALDDKGGDIPIKFKYINSLLD